MSLPNLCQRVHDVQPSPGRSLRYGIGVVAVLVAVAVVVVPRVAAGAAAPEFTVSFEYTGGVQYWTVPARVTQVQVDAFGAQGADRGPRGHGGLGAEEVGEVAVTAGDTLAIRVGGQGGQPDVYAGGWNGGGRGGHQGGPAGNDGGGGGGASDVIDVTSHPDQTPVVAGGGGGGGGDEPGIGNGGDGGSGDGDGADGKPSCGTYFSEQSQAKGGYWQIYLDQSFGGFGALCGATIIGGSPQDVCVAEELLAHAPAGDCDGDGKPNGTGGNAECCIGGGGGGGGGGYTIGAGGGAADWEGGGGGGGAGGESHGGRPGASAGNAGNGRVVISYVQPFPTTTTLLAAPSSASLGQPISFTATVSPTPEGGTMQFTIDGTDFGPPVPVDARTGTATSTSTSSLTVGSHTIAANYSGDFNYAPSNASATVTVTDTTAPTTTATLSPDSPNGTNGWYTTAVQLTVSASDPDDAVAQTRCVLDPGGVPVNLAAMTGNCSYLGAGAGVSADGSHILYYASADSNGNIEAVGSVSFKIDATPPALNVGNLAADATSPSGATVDSYTVSAADGGSGLAGTACMPPAPHQFPIGDTTVTCTAKDNAGNATTGHFVVHVLGASEQVSNLATAVHALPPGTSLAGKIQTIQNDLTSDDTRRGCNALQAFTNEVQAQSGKKLTTTQAGQLITDTIRIRTVIGC